MIHLQALAATVFVMMTVLMHIKGVWLSLIWLTCASIYLMVTMVVWIKQSASEMSVISRQGLVWGLFGAGMFVFSYLMVPLYHILCHGGQMATGSGGHVLEVNLMAAEYRSVPVDLKLSKKQMTLGSDDEQIVYVTLHNKAAKPMNLHLSIASQPRTLKSSFGLVVPDQIELLPWQKTTFPVAVKFLGHIPDDLWQSALLFLLQDTNGVGQLGQTTSWKKMHGGTYKDGVR